MDRFGPLLHTVWRDLQFRGLGGSGWAWLGLAGLASLCLHLLKGQGFSSKVTWILTLNTRPQ